jgi:hypothetical protein
MFVQAVFILTKVKYETKIWIRFTVTRRVSSEEKMD